jgi:hypothetical protein
MNEPFVDYYDFLAIDPGVSPDAISEAIGAARRRINQERLIPHKSLWVEKMDYEVGRAEAVLGDPIQRARYDTERDKYYAMMRQQQHEDDDLLFIGPQPYVFYSGDPDPAYTVPGLARKFDTDVTQAIAEVREQAVESMLRYVGYGRPNQKRYDALADQIANLRERLAEQHPLQMLESVAVLCDATIERPRVRIDDLATGESDLPSISLRPDRAAQVTVQLSHIRSADDAHPRGCLFGYLWIEDNWATLSSPTSANVEIGGSQRPARWFEFNAPTTVGVALQFDPDQLMRLDRPATHRLRIGLLSQIDTAHEQRQFFTLPVQVTTIPAQGAFSPPTLILPTVRRGQIAEALATLVNTGQDPLEAALLSTSDGEILVTPAMLADAGSVTVQVNTSALRFGSSYEKEVTYSAQGDSPRITLRVQGEVLPTVLQHISRQQSIIDRATLALLFAFIPLTLYFFAPSLAPAASDWPFWAISVLAVTGATVGVSVWITRRIIGHIQATGETKISPQTVRWGALLGGAGGAAALLTALLAILPLQVDTKISAIFLMLLVLAAAWGFFIKEDLAIYRRGRGTGKEQPSLIERFSPDTRKGLKVTAGVVSAVIAIVALAQFAGGQFPLFTLTLLALAILAVFA